MSDDLADYPIVVLENDYPERAGKVGLFDYIMPVGSTGMIFVAAVPGTLYLWGPSFADAVKNASNLRAASTLIQMGLIRGETFAFMRRSMQLTQAELAALDGVPEATVVGWENNTIPIPRTIWDCLANMVCLADGRALPVDTALCPSFRPRRIRVFPNMPMVVTPQPQGLPCSPPTPLVGPNCLPMKDPLC